MTLILVWCRSGILIVNFHQFSHLFGVSNVDFEQVNAGWDFETIIKSKYISLKKI